MLENEHGSFAGDAGNFSEHKLVGHQVAQHGNGDAGKGLDDFGEMCFAAGAAHNAVICGLK